MLDPETLIIIGSSVRAAAQSAKRAGFQPWCIDQFGDRDLAEISTDMTTVSDWPSGIEAAFEKAPHANWVYAGALENRPELIARLAERHPLLGCSGEALVPLRDPAWLAQTLAKASLPNLPIVLPSSSGKSMPTATLTENCRQNREWIVKPLASAAGLGVHEFDGAAEQWTEREGHFLQRRMEGRVVSGLYLSTGSSARLLGMCEQLCRGTEAGDFCYVYAGSLGPLSEADISPVAFEQAQRIGSAISDGVNADGLSLRGLFGIDFILDDKNGEVCTLEVNPRYPASAELYERAFEWPLTRWHVDACREHGSTVVSLPLAEIFKRDDYKHGKMIVYAQRDFTASDIVPLIEQLSCQSSGSLSVADIPHVGTLIRKDEPICTLLTDQENIAKCHSTLSSMASKLLAAIDQLSV
jgi:predicted ATP-grasp superfamily ATP-dependent carboligase